MRHLLVSIFLLWGISPVNANNILIAEQRALENFNQKEKEAYLLKQKAIEERKETIRKRNEMFKQKINPSQQQSNTIK